MTDLAWLLSETTPRHSRPGHRAVCTSRRSDEGHATALRIGAVRYPDRAEPHVVMAATNI